MWKTGEGEPFFVNLDNDNAMLVATANQATTKKLAFKTKGASTPRNVC